MCCNPGIFTSDSHFQPPCHSSYKWRRNRDLNPGHIGGRRMLWLLRHPCVWCCLRFQSSHPRLLPASLNILLVLNFVDCKTVGFFLKISKKKKGKVSVSLTRAKRASLTNPTTREFSVSPQSRSLFSASFQTFCLTARAYLNTQKYRLFCSLLISRF